MLSYNDESFRRLCN